MTKKPRRQPAAAKKVPESNKSELSEEELNKVSGGTENISFNYGSMQVQYTKQSTSG
jgi:bacteriocin-like protein